MTDWVRKFRRDLDTPLAKPTPPAVPPSKPAAPKKKDPAAKGFLPMPPPEVLRFGEKWAMKVAENDIRKTEKEWIDGLRKRKAIMAKSQPPLGLSNPLRTWPKEWKNSLFLFCRECKIKFVDTPPSDVRLCEVCRGLICVACWKKHRHNKTIPK